MAFLVSPPHSPSVPPLPLTPFLLSHSTPVFQLYIIFYLKSTKSLSHTHKGMVLPFWLLWTLIYLEQSFFLLLICVFSIIYMLTYCNIIPWYKKICLFDSKSFFIRFSIVVICLPYGKFHWTMRTFFCFIGESIL